MADLAAETAGLVFLRQECAWRGPGLGSRPTVSGRTAGIGVEGRLRVACRCLAVGQQSACRWLEGCLGGNTHTSRIPDHSKPWLGSTTKSRIPHHASLPPLQPFFIVELGTPVARRPPHRSRRAVFPHRALQVNSLSHTPASWPPVAGRPATAGTNSTPAGKAFAGRSFPQCTVAALGIVPASD